MESRPVVVLLLYASLMLGVSALIARIGASVARQATQDMAFNGDTDPRPSRVDRGLEALDRVSQWQPVSRVVEIRASEPPEVSAVELASALDSAESADLPHRQIVLVAGPKPKLKPKAKAKASRARVAGWIRRVPRQEAHRAPIPETTAQIIERRLRAEM